MRMTNNNLEKYSVSHYNFTTFATPNSPVHIAEQVINNDSISFSHDHDFYEFFLVYRGSLIHHLNGEEIILHEKTVQFIFPQDTHSFQVNSNDMNASLINIAFPVNLLSGDLVFLSNYLLRIVHKNSQRHLSVSDSLWSVYLDKIRYINSASSYNKKLAVFQSLLMDILVEFLNTEDTKNHDIPMWLEKAYSEMEKKDNYISGLNRFIELSGKSQEHLTRQMKKHYSKTPTEYINDLRLQESARMLVHTNESVLNIIFKSGFINVSYFIKLFKQKYSMTPNEYRNSNKKIFAIE